MIIINEEIKKEISIILLDSVQEIPIIIGPAGTDSGWIFKSISTNCLTTFVCNFHPLLPGTWTMNDFISKITIVHFQLAQLKKENLYSIYLTSIFYPMYQNLIHYISQIASEVYLTYYRVLLFPFRYFKYIW